MSDGPKQAVGDAPTLVTLTTEEFGQVCHRLHRFLLKRAERARLKRDAHPSDRAVDSHIEAAKDVFVFVHMTEIIEAMGQEISDLRGIITSLGAAADIAVERANEEVDVLAPPGKGGKQWMN